MKRDHRTYLALLELKTRLIRLRNRASYVGSRLLEVADASIPEDIKRSDLDFLKKVTLDALDAYDKLSSVEETLANLIDYVEYRQQSSDPEAPNLRLADEADEAEGGEA